MICPLIVALRLSQSSDELTSSERLKHRKFSIAYFMEEQKASVDNSNVLSLHCGVTAKGESNLKSSKTREWSDMTIAEYSITCTDGNSTLSIKKKIYP